MAAGKTTVGRLLAERLGKTFIDLDERIEREEGRTIAQIFASDGEGRFRELESRHLANAIELPESVIALGGGAFLGEENRRLIAEHGVTIFLDTPFETLLSRLRLATDRPLNQGDGFLKSLYEARLPVYRKADVLVRADGRPEETVSLILKRLTGC